MPPPIILKPYKIQSEVIDVQGYLTIAVYIHYFLPGSIKIQTSLRTVKLGQLAALIDHRQLEEDTIAYDTRRNGRWFPKREMPYPGYCRAPGSAVCIPALCNCKFLAKKWKTYLAKQKKLKEKPIVS